MSLRPPVFTWSEELHFGPPSEPISIQAFLDEAQELQSRGLFPWASTNPSTAITGWQEWEGLHDDVKSSVENDCNLENDIKSSLLITLKSQKRVAYLQNLHATAVTKLVPPPPSGKKKAQARKTATERYDQELEEFKRTVEETRLKMWKLNASAKPYIRPGHIRDQNALDTLKLRNSGSDENLPPFSHEVLIAFTAYTRNTWYPYAFSRDARHVLTSSHTLADLWTCVPCAIRGDGNMPDEVIEIDTPTDALGHSLEAREERVVNYTTGSSHSNPDHVVMVVEGVAYSDGRDSPDYADKLLVHYEAFKLSPPEPDALPPLPSGPYERPASLISLTKGLPIDAVQLRSLVLRINEPYWIMHRGNCEHWFVIDEIRLQNPRDPTSGYPVGLQRTPVFRPLCRICSKVPASLSVLNDVRIGESPGPVCQPCWDILGGPPQPNERDDPSDRVLVVPMASETL